MLQSSVEELRFALEWLDLSRAMSVILSAGRGRRYQVDDVAEILVADSCMDMPVARGSAWSYLGRFPEQLGEVSLKVSEQTGRCFDELETLIVFV